jgi:hypothetical protein
MTPKDWIVYIDHDNKTRAVVDWHTGTEVEIAEEGNLVIGFVSFACEKDAVDYGDQVLR